MRILMAAALAGAFVVMDSGVTLAQERGEVGIARGEVPAATEVESLDGETVDLGDFIGEKPLVMEFWASWCENCEALQPSMDAAYEAYGDQVNFLAVAVAVAQTQRAVRRHLERHPIPFPMLWDAEGAAVRAFLAPATSYVVALDATGTVVYTGIGPSQDITAAARLALVGTTESGS